MIPDCTLVTACFDLTMYNKHSRSFNESLNKMESLLQVPCYLIIFTDKIAFLCIIKPLEENIQVLIHLVYL